MIGFDALVDAIFLREGDVYSEPPKNDQPTARGGITLPTLVDYVQATHAPIAQTVDTLRTMTRDQARAIVRWKLESIVATHHLEQIAFEPLRWLVVDFAYNSGGALAIRWLQRVLGVPRTSVLDAPTVAALLYPDIKRIPVWIHEALLAARLQMVGDAVDAHTIAASLEHGLTHRVNAFSLLEVP